METQFTKSEDKIKCELNGFQEDQNKTATLKVDRASRCNYGNTKVPASNN